MQIVFCYSTNKLRNVSYIIRKTILFFLLFSEQYFREPCVALFRFFPFIIHTGVINIHDASMSVSFSGKQDIDVHKRGYMYRRISKITEPEKKQKREKSVIVEMIHRSGVEQ